MIRAEAADERAEEGRREARTGDRRVGEGGADLTVDILDSVLRRNLRQVGGPLDAAGLLELGERRIGRLEEWPQRGVVDDEVDLRPVLRRLAYVPDRVVLPHIGPRLLVVGGQQPLVD